MLAFCALILGTSAWTYGELAGEARAKPAAAASPLACRSAVKGLHWYFTWTYRWTVKRLGQLQMRFPQAGPCPRYLASVWRAKARTARARYVAHREYHYAWQKWLPDKWQRIGACETGYGQRPGRWDWNSGAYQGAFGFAVSSWDAFVPRADRRAGPYPSEAYLATPRQQYEVALAIYRMFGFSGWGCRGA